MITIYTVLQKTEEALLGGSILGIALLTILNVLARNVFGRSLAFAEEASQFLIIVTCFVGLSYAAGQGRHIRMTAIYDQLPYRTRKVMMIFICATTAAIMLVLCVYSVRYVWTVYQLGGIYPALRIPFYYVYAVAPVGFFLAAVQNLHTLVKNLQHPEIYRSPHHLDTYASPSSPPASPQEK